MQHADMSRLQAQDMQETHAAQGDSVQEGQGLARCSGEEAI